MRREFPTKVRLEALARCMGHCEQCGWKLMDSADYHYDHVAPDGIGGEPTLDNCQVLCRGCHREKTRKIDVPRVAKMKRQRNKNFGIYKPKRPWPKRKFA